jgi:hypothetical protein
MEAMKKPDDKPPAHRMEALRMGRERALDLGKKVKDPTPAEFFRGNMSALLQKNQERCRAVGGRFGFKIVGESGGEWTIDLDSASVNEGVVEGADVIVELGADQFALVLRNRVDVAQWIREKKLHIRGSIEALGKLGVAFS